MRLTDLRPTHESFMYLERYVNDGSPSGFSIVNTPGRGFRAVDPAQDFDLPIFECAQADALHVGGPPTLSSGELPVHPEMADGFSALIGRSPRRYLRAAATSSGRTLAVQRDGMSFYVKVAYQGLLGRVTRKMTMAHVLSAVEVSSAYERAIATGTMPSTLHIYRERCGLHFPAGSALQDWGYVERDIEPHPNGQFIQVPAFSLIAKPKEGAPSLLLQLLNVAACLRTVEGCFERLVRPLLDMYFSSVAVTGLQPEAHAQNITYLLDTDYAPVGIALRDMESVDKDLPLLEQRGLAGSFTATGYKFLTKDAYNYQIMHSFMYDFKLGVYLLGPLIDEWASHQGADALTELECRIKTYARERLTQLPGDFFPEEVWYDYDAVVHEGSSTRRYRQHPRPRFR